MKSQVKWIEDYQFVGMSDSGHGVLIDGSGGPKDKPSVGASPMELILMGLGGCAGIDIVMILKKSRENIIDCVVDVDAKRADDVPSVFTDIHLIFTVTGTNLTEAKVENAVRLSADKYCSVSMMLGKACNITRETKIIEA